MPRGAPAFQGNAPALRRGRLAVAEPFDEKDLWPPERLWQMAWRRLKRVLRHAYRRLPFYQQRFHQAGVTPDDIRTPAHLSRIPILTKAEVVALQAQGGGGLFGMEWGRREPSVFLLSSGTVGTATLWEPWSKMWLRSWACARAYWHMGLRPGMRALMVAPTWHLVALLDRMVFDRIIPCQAVIVPWGTHLPVYAGHLLDAILETRPQFVNMFLPMLYALLAECQRRGLEARQAFASFHTLGVTGAGMTIKAWRELHRRLGVRELLEGYGHAEAVVSHGCSAHLGHHLMLESSYVEIVDPTTGQPLPPGQRGLVVSTVLIPQGSLYIRFAPGDIGELLPLRCPCGLPWPLLEVYGRVEDQVTVAGRALLPYDVRACLDEVPELLTVSAAIVRRHGPMSRLELVLESPPGADLAQLERKVEEAIWQGLGLEVQVRWAQALPVRWKGTPVIDEAEVGHV